MREQSTMNFTSSFHTNEEVLLPSDESDFTHFDGMTGKQLKIFVDRKLFLRLYIMCLFIYLFFTNNEFQVYETTFLYQL